MTFRILFIIFVLVGFVGVVPAYAQSAGDPCTIQGEYITYNNSGTFTVLICDGANYVQTMITDGNGTFLKFGNTTTTCDSTKAGLMRYDDAEDMWEFCDGNGNWRRM